MKNTTKGLTAFKNQIFLYGIAVALIFEAGSLLFLGFNAFFAYGLALGTAIAIVNFNILVFISRRLLDRGNAWMGFVGYIVRLAVYGFAFYMALRVGHVAAIGAALGFITLKFAIYWRHGFRGLRLKSAKGRDIKPLPQKEKRRKGLMKDIFGSPYDDEDEDGPDED
jgi:thiol:disulfide interchange protein